MTDNRNHLLLEARSAQTDRNIPGTVVFYDGGCPMCSREIAHYKRLDRKQSVLWVDITRQSKTLALYGVSHTAAMQRFHVLNIEGKWQIGAWGFVEMWSQLPGYRWLAKAIRWINAESLLDRVYVGFAKWRAKHRCVEECRPLQ